MTENSGRRDMVPWGDLTEIRGGFREAVAAELKEASSWHKGEPLRFWTEIVVQSLRLV